MEYLETTDHEIQGRSGLSANVFPETPQSFQAVFQDTKVLLMSRLVAIRLQAR